jgi:queuine tRNA-ribosyltransferase
VCQRHSRGYLRHLLQVGEPTGARLITLHNLAWTFALFERMRSCVESGTLDALRREVAGCWE